MIDRVACDVLGLDADEEERRQLKRELEEVCRWENRAGTTLVILGQMESVRPLTAEYLEIRQSTQEELAQLKRRRAELESALAPPPPPPPAAPPPPEPEAPPEPAPLVKRHAAHASAQWFALCVEPDFCRVGPGIVAFDSFATLDEPVIASPNVKAQGTPVYRQGDVFRVVQADAGSHVVSGTALECGHVKLLDGQSNIKVNGLPLARHGSTCLINCDADGNGGALGQIFTLREQIRRNAEPPTHAQLEEDLRNYNVLYKAARQKADSVEQNQQYARRELNDTSRLSPYDWPRRDALNERISALEQERQALGQDLLYYRHQAESAASALYGDQPRMSSPLTSHETRELQRQREEQRKVADRLGVVAMGPVAGALPALVDMAGGPSEAMEDAADISMSALPIPGPKGVGGRGLGNRPRNPVGGRARVDAEAAGPRRAREPAASEGVHIQPRLRTLQEMQGQSEGGPGIWEASPKRTGGEEYQEQISGVERGAEYTVNGVRFDGYDASRNVLLDAKDWRGYPPEGTVFWQKGVIKDALRQIEFAGGTPIEWHVSTQSAATSLREVIGQKGIKINVVFTPKR
ncbi:Tox-REase-5 domain-containing protein [Pseudomonas sp. ZM23]|uniref:Tox-REase-5 domain-containing protein n=1 Tax=Pseudomonas triclosanedens TaxID=2961893 RepID=A0ABY6ZXF0_9PSED|nr:Tox-REase-5 domain-containing protein [Pseudomonas triclosanedens]MCP8462442.1 Tox-REase-5 domain-containing protein [Pseudomonas triclosanedens]MCP8468080.1 Tox-REase-5 domain-containing protein [Pseudomonas triclosanedens]MCP8474839.1 Tox-REase-5 domain-containing protein [Pseudomonas triclosanedens]WAI49637.1 Tox-REase-5 domain-containing protein [Pseudomonas triclosanedens]